MLAKKHSGYAINLWRALIATVLFSLWVVFIETTGNTGFVEALASITPAQFLWLFISVICSYVVGDVLFFKSTKYLGGPAALAIASTFPAVAAIWGWVVEGHHLTSSGILGLVLTITGTILVILDSGDSRGLSRTGDASEEPALIHSHQSIKNIKGIFLGVLLAFMTAGLWAGNAICVAKVGRDIAPGLMNVVRMGLSAMICALFLWRTNSGQKLSFTQKFSPKAFRVYIFVFVLESFGGALTYTYGLSHAPLAVAATLSSLAPVLTVPITLMRKTEKISLKKGIGIFFVTVGICLLVSV